MLSLKARNGGSLLKDEELHMKQRRKPGGSGSSALVWKPKRLVLVLIVVLAVLFVLLKIKTHKLYPLGCAQGHINRKHPVNLGCADIGCLIQLNTSLVDKDTVLEELEKKIEKIKKHGKVDNEKVEDITFLHLLTKMQWGYGYYGSVGQMGISCTTENILAVASPEAGEQVFVFDDPGSAKCAGFDKDYRISNLNEYLSTYGISTDSKDDQHRIKYFDINLLQKETFVNNKLSAVRLYGISNTQSKESIFTGLQHAICVLREGGIVVLQDLNDANPRVLQAVKQFTDIHKQFVLLPLIQTQSNLYLCTAEKHLAYMTHLLRYKEAHYLCDVYDEYHGVKSTYYKTCKAEKFQ